MPPPVPTVSISARAAKRLVAGHPWVYRSDLSHPQRPTPAAALVNVADERGRFLASALSSSASQIALRTISEKQLPDDTSLLELLRERIRVSIHYRNTVVRDSNAYRVVFSEADGLPGVIVDRYNDVLTLQVLTQALDRAELKQIVLDTLQEAFAGTSIVERSEPRIPELEALPPLESRL